MRVRERVKSEGNNEGSTVKAFTKYFQLPSKPLPAMHRPKTCHIRMKGDAHTVWEVGGGRWEVGGGRWEVVLQVEGILFNFHSYFTS